MATHWHISLTRRQIAPLFGVLKSAVDRIIDHTAPLLALQPKRRFGKDTVLIVPGILVPTRGHSIAEKSKNYRYPTNHQVVSDANTRLFVAAGRPVPGNRNDSQVWAEFGAKDLIGRTTRIADGGYPGTGLIIPHRNPKGGEVPAWKKDHSHGHERIRARVERAFACVKTYKILRDCRQHGDGIRHAMHGVPP